MSRLVEARERLEAAIGRLDGALNHRLEAARNDPQKEQLVRDLQMARVECDRLKAERSKTVARLDSSIQRLQGILATD